MTARRTRLRALAGNLSWLLASNGLMAALSLIYLGLLTRTLGIVDFGRFSLITGAAQMLAMLVSFETWKIVVQYGLRHAEANDQPALARLLKASMAAELASAAAGIVIVALALLASPALGLPHRLLPYAALFAIAQLLSLRSTPTGILRLKDRYGRGALADSVQPLGRLFGTLAMLAFWPSIEGFLIAYAIAEIATALVCWWLALRLTDIAQLRRTHFDRHAALAENPGLLAALWSTNVQASLASRQVPLLVVGSHDGPAAAGAFRLALQLANALAKLATLVMRAAFPEIVRTVSAVTRERFWALAGRIALAGFAGAVLVFLLVLLLGKPLLVLIGGSDFGVAYVLLIWLASAGCVEIAAAAFEPILFSIRRAGTVITARAAAVIVQLGAMAILIPALGARGASISVLIGALLFGIFLAIGLRRAARSA